MDDIRKILSFHLKASAVDYSIKKYTLHIYYIPGTYSMGYKDSPKIWFLPCSYYQSKTQDMCQKSHRMVKRSHKWNKWATLE